MQTKTKIIIGVSVVALLGGVGYFLWKRKKEKEGEVAVEEPSTPTDTESTPSAKSGGTSKKSTTTASTTTAKTEQPKPSTDKNIGKKAKSRGSNTLNKFFVKSGSKEVKNPDGTYSTVSTGKTYVKSASTANFRDKEEIGIIRADSGSGYYIEVDSLLGDYFVWIAKDKILV